MLVVHCISKQHTRKLKGLQSIDIWKYQSGFYRDYNIFFALSVRKVKNSMAIKVFNIDIVE